MEERNGMCVYGGDGRGGIRMQRLLVLNPEHCMAAETDFFVWFQNDLFTFVPLPLQNSEARGIISNGLLDFQIPRLLASKLFSPLVLR